MRREANVYTMFCDGEPVASGSFTSPLRDTTAPVAIGGSIGNRQFGLGGKIDDVAIWGRALANSEISALYLLATGPPRSAATDVEFVCGSDWQVYNDCD